MLEFFVFWRSLKNFSFDSFYCLTYYFNVSNSLFNLDSRSDYPPSFFTLSNYSVNTFI